MVTNQKTKMSAQNDKLTYGEPFYYTAWQLPWYNIEYLDDYKNSLGMDEKNVRIDGNKISLVQFLQHAQSNAPSLGASYIRLYIVREGTEDESFKNMISEIKIE